MSELAYFTMFRMAVEMCKTREDLKTLWREQAESRAALGITDGSDNHRRLVEICAMKNAQIFAAQAAE